MKKTLIFLIFFIFLSGFLNLIFTKKSNSSDSNIFPSSPDAWRYFYNLLRPSADVKCLSGDTALEKITNCIKTVTRALRYLGVILFIIGLTYVAGLLVISPFKQDLIQQGKTILLWIIIGFIILFIIEKIMELIQWLARG